jgi:hypothetical protein
MANDDERRPYPPVNFIASDNWQPYTRLIPANEVHEWINRQILSDTGSIHNPDHEHLLRLISASCGRLTRSRRKGATFSVRPNR